VKKILVACIALITMNLAAVGVVHAAPFSKDQTTQIETIVHDYLIAHPDILIQMSQELQQQQYQQMQQKAMNVIKDNSAQIFGANGTQVAGNPNGTVTLVEFFDYQCVHCANVHKDHVIENLIGANPNLRVVYKEFPIFGEGSVYASKAALAATLQGKYLQLHDAIFATGKIEGNLKPADVDAAAKKAGLNIAKMKKDMQLPQIKADLDADYKLAQALGLPGTPGFIIAPTPKIGNSAGKTAFIPGLASADNLQQAINAAK
jgi:protein-disulfide isomerase